jgi:hypothetical protein
MTAFIQSENGFIYIYIYIYREREREREREEGVGKKSKNMFHGAVINSVRHLQSTTVVPQ